MSNNKLFFVCPFSNLETFFRNHYGDEVYFATSMGGIFLYNDKNSLNYFNEFINRRNIKEIILVVDTSCRFLNNVLKQRKDLYTYAEKIIESILLFNSHLIDNQATLTRKQQKLAALVIDHEIDKLLKIPMFANLREDRKIAIKGLLLCRIPIA